MTRGYVFFVCTAIVLIATGVYFGETGSTELCKHLFAGSVASSIFGGFWLLYKY